MSAEFETTLPKKLAHVPLQEGQPVLESSMLRQLIAQMSDVTFDKYLQSLKWDSNRESLSQDDIECIVQQAFVRFETASSNETGTQPTNTTNIIDHLAQGTIIERWEACEMTKYWGSSLTTMSSPLNWIFKET